jgi:hypothetical protein
MQKSFTHNMLKNDMPKVLTGNCCAQTDALNQEFSVARPLFTLAQMR